MFSQAGANGAALVTADVMTLQDRVVGTNSQKVLIMNKQDRRALTNLVVTAAGGAAVRDVGSLIDNFNGSPIEVLDEDGDEAAILGKDETRGSSNVTSSIYCIRFGGDGGRGVRPGADQQRHDRARQRRPARHLLLRHRRVQRGHGDVPPAQRGPPGRHPLIVGLTSDP
jgi:hypothetical protein